MRAEPKPDAAIFSVAFGQAVSLLEVAEERGIPFFLNGPLFPEELATLGGAPRRDYRTWIGYFIQDEEEKGYLLARKLIAAARAAGRVAPDGAVQVVGIGGDATWYGSALREAGLRRAVAEDPMAHLLQTVPTRWTPAEGREMTTRLLARYPEVTVVWAASDQLALGAAEGLRSRGLEPDRTGFTGGLDLSLVGLEAVRDGTLTATVAATTLIWAEVLVCLHHYLQSADIDDRPGVEISFPPEVATKTTAEEFIGLRGQYETIDFSELEPCRNQRREDDR